MKQGPTGRSSPVSLNAVSVVPCQATRRAGRATPGFALQKREICTRLFQPDFVALLMYRSIGRSPAIRSISFKCCSKATDFG
jgi:hypothetical protein